MEKSEYKPGPPRPDGLGAVRQYSCLRDRIGLSLVTFNIDGSVYRRHRDPLPVKL
jgi:hypothetical protein